MLFLAVYFTIGIMFALAVKDEDELDYTPNLNLEPGLNGVIISIIWPYALWCIINDRDS